MTPHTLILVLMAFTIGLICGALIIEIFDTIINADDDESES